MGGTHGGLWRARAVPLMAGCGRKGDEQCTFEGVSQVLIACEIAMSVGNYVSEIQKPFSPCPLVARLRRRPPRAHTSSRAAQRAAAALPERPAARRSAV